MSGEGQVPQCHVLRCTNRAAEVVDVSSPEQLRLDAVVCAEHKAAMDVGERWVWDDQRGGAAPLLMGDDLPPLLTPNWQAEQRHMSSQPGRTWMLRLEHQNGDGTVDYTEYEMNEEFRESFKRFLGLG